MNVVKFFVRKIVKKHDVKNGMSILSKTCGLELQLKQLEWND